MHLPELGQIPDAIQQADTSDQGIVWIRHFDTADDPTAHEFVFFIKPELLMDDPAIKRLEILEYLDGKLAEYGVTLGSLSVLNAHYLRQYGVMQLHYGVINRISREGRTALTQEAEEKLQSEFADLLKSDTPVLGGHQVLEQHSELGAQGVEEIWAQKPSVKLAGGSYAADVQLDGQTVIMLNGFHPSQLEHFQVEGRRIAVATGRSKRPWAELRATLVGATNPVKAVEGSIRAELLARKDEFGLPTVDQGNNGVHLSAGPLEGLVELTRFAGDRAAGIGISLAQTCFGRLLSRAGMLESQIALLMDNPTLSVDGKDVSAFDLTEEMDAPDAVRALAEQG